MNRQSKPGPVRQRSVMNIEVEQLIAARLSRCIENLMVLANGVVMDDPEAEDGSKKYTRPPDRAANEYLLNRLLGRPASKKPMDELVMAPDKRVDLSRVPRYRLELMEKWLTEADADRDTTEFDHVRLTLSEHQVKSE